MSATTVVHLSDLIGEDDDVEGKNVESRNNVRVDQVEMTLMLTGSQLEGTTVVLSQEDDGNLDEDVTGNEGQQLVQCLDGGYEEEGTGGLNYDDVSYNIARVFGGENTSNNPSVLTDGSLTPGKTMVLEVDDGKDEDEDDDDDGIEGVKAGGEEGMDTDAVDGAESTVVIDISNPIQLCQNSLIVVNGQKCVLQQNNETGQLFAYPIKEPEKPRKKRGRPRKVRVVCEGELGEEDLQGQDAMVQQGDEVDLCQEDIEKGFVEKSNEAGEIVKRSARKRKKARTLNDYETGVLKLEGTSEDEEEVDDEDDEPRKKLGRGRGRPKKLVSQMGTTPLASLLQPAKRRRGRPRRYGLKPDSPETQVYLIQLSDGRTLFQVPAANMQAGMSVQNFALNLPESLQLPQTIVAQPQVKTPVAIAPRPPTTPASNVSMTTPIPQSDEVSTDQVDKQLSFAEGQDVDLQAEFEDKSNEESLLNSSEKPEEDEGSTLRLEAADEEEEPPPSTTTIIPDGSLTMVPLIINKQEAPIKIGLKASENDLEKLRCPKCEFQAYYQQQYQDHLALHPDDVHRCKCCSYLALDENELHSHYKETHPKCICTVCNHTAEHAYIIKRHMYRHSDTGCTCQVCGKTYKDHYILKMHMKMVHMPAEVFFKCQVCTKNFTRKAHLKRHLRTHAPNKPYKCTLCDYRGCEKSDITKHMLIHQDPKHKCEDCGKTFRHIKNKELHVKRHKGQRDYKCGACEFFGYTFTDIRKHIERKHQDTKTIICERCGQAFKTDSHMKEHERSGQCELFVLDQTYPESDLIAGASDAGGGDATCDVAVGDVDGQLEDVSITLHDGTSATWSQLAASGQLVLSDGKLHHIAHSAQLVDAEGQQLTIVTTDDGSAQVAMVMERGEYTLVTDAVKEKENLVDLVETSRDAAQDEDAAAFALNDAFQES